MLSSSLSHICIYMCDEVSQAHNQYLLGIIFAIGGFLNGITHLGYAGCDYKHYSLLYLDYFHHHFTGYSTLIIWRYWCGKRYHLSENLGRNSASDHQISNLYKVMIPVNKAKVTSYIEPWEVKMTRYAHG